MKAWQELGGKLRHFVNPGTFPIAIRLLEKRAEIPDGVRSPLKDLRVKMAHCQAAAVARKYGWTIAMTKDDLGCAISGHTYGWEVANEEGVIDFLTRMNYAADRTSALSILQSFRTLPPGRCEAMVYSPLEWTKIEPQVVLIYLDPAQLMRCIHGSTHATGRPVLSSFSGRAASCTEGVIGAFLDQSPKVVIPGNGDRVWAAAQDHEMAYAIPASHLKDLVEGLAKTHGKGIRYPIPAFLRYSPEVGLTVPLTDIFKK